jgi:hypothetical protein
MDSLFDITNNKFYPENPEGNIEYKWRLDTKNNLGHAKLLTQLLWRINEGYELNGIKEAEYLIGVYDNGKLGELSVDTLIKSINILKKIITEINLIIISEEIKNINNSYVYYAKIKKEDKLKINEKKIVVIGEQQSGKTTLISRLCYDSNITKYVLKHEHEKISGTTTDIKKEIIGIKNDKIINYSDYGGWDDIALNSNIIINIYDIPVINLKSIINYLLGINPDFIFICFKNENSLETKFYIEYCRFYNIQYQLIDFNKIINFDKEYLNNIIINVSKLNYINTLNDINSKIFRIIDYYDIPEKGLILSGLQINKEFNENDNCILINGQNYYDINIKCIHKKTIKVNQINENESGSFNIEFINKNKHKLSKNSYIIDNTIDNIIKTNKKYKIKMNKSLENGIYKMNIFNCNFSYNDVSFEIINDEIEFIDDIYIQDKKILMQINNNNNFNFNDLFMIFII